MKIAVCDDEKIFREEIIETLYGFFGRLELECTEYETGDELLRTATAWDAIFLDIEMPGSDGMTTAKTLRENGYTGPIIFLTSHTELAMDGYEVSAFRFLAKPLHTEKIQQMLYDLKQELTAKKRLLLRYEGEDIVLPLSEIRYVEANNNSVSVVTTDREYTVRKKLSDIEKELSEQADCFVKIHRCYLVNLAHVQKVHGTEVFITGNAALPISRSVVSDFKKQLFDYVKNSAR